MKTTRTVLFGILTITVSLAVHVQAQSFLTNGLVAYYPFAGNANDASGNGNHGTLNGTDYQFSPDRFGNLQSALFLNTTSTYALNLNGTYVVVPRAAGLDFTHDFTVSLWVNVSDISGAMLECVFCSANQTGLFNFGSFGYLLHPNAVYAAGQDDWSAGFFEAGGPDVWLPPTRNGWWQATIVRSGMNLSFFKNGSVLTNGVVTGVPQNGSTIQFGMSLTPGKDGSTYAFVGGIDDVRMYNRALSTNEVQQLYAFESQPLITLRKAVSPSFTDLYPGTNYQLQVSTDLNTWTNSGSPFAATNAVMAYPQYFDVGDWGQLFFRLQTSP